MGTIAATGGTFDILHRGHHALLAAALEKYDHTIIGLVTDDFAIQLGKKPLYKYKQRLISMHRLLQHEFPGRSYEITPLKSEFGPAVLRGDIDALVASDETYKSGDTLNKMRARRGLKPVDVVVVHMVPGCDGIPISTTRIRNDIIDREGNTL